MGINAINELSEAYNDSCSFKKIQEIRTILLSTWQFCKQLGYTREKKLCFHIAYHYDRLKTSRERP